jgi:hypothetical protein
MIYNSKKTIILCVEYLLLILNSQLLPVANAQSEKLSVILILITSQMHEYGKLGNSYSEVTVS